VAFTEDRFQLRHLVAVHGCLQCTDRVDFGDDDARALAAEGLRRTLADVAVTANDGDFAAHEDVGGTVDAVRQRVPDAVLVVELALGHGVVDVDGREEQLALLRQLVQTVHARGGFFRDTQQAGADAGPFPGIRCERGTQDIEEDTPLIGLVHGCRRNGPEGFEFDALVDQHGGVAAVVEDHVRTEVRVAVRAGPGEDLLGGPPVFLEGLALPGKDGDALRVFDRAVAHHNGGGGFVLGGEDVAGGPADLGAQSSECFDQHGGLDGHVERTGNPGALERLAGAELFAQGHESGHLVLREADLVAAGLSQ
jgi:hypothetical protein